MRFANNLKLPERMRDKTLGQIKHTLSVNLEIRMKDIKIDWERKWVEIKGEKVAWFEGGEIKYDKEGLKVEEQVSNHMKEWLMKRGIEGGVDLE